MMADGDKQHWALDKKVPISLITAIAIQTAGAFWWAASLSARVDYLEREATRNAPQAGQIIKLETRLDNIQSTLEDVKSLLRAR